MLDPLEIEVAKREAARTREDCQKAGVIGPWLTEPDRAEWEHAGYPCLAVRNPHTLTWCGYVGVTARHPDYGKVCDLVKVMVHGGLTYANKCNTLICHTPKEGEPDDRYWFGFDCAHYFDLAPGIEARTKLSGFDFEKRRELLGAAYYTATQYRDLGYVRQETNSLAEQLKAHETPAIL